MLKTFRYNINVFMYNVSEFLTNNLMLWLNLKNTHFVSVCLVNNRVCSVGAEGQNDCFKGQTGGTLTLYTVSSVFFNGETSRSLKNPNNQLKGRIDFYSNA